MTQTKTETTNRFGIVPGDVFYTSWGYDQTNVDFYLVTRVTAAKAEVTPIGSTVVDGQGTYQHVVPNPDHIREWDVLIGIDRDDVKKSKLCSVRTGYKGDPVIVLSGDRGHSAWRWDGTPKYETGPYGGH